MGRKQVYLGNTDIPIAQLKRGRSFDFNDRNLSIAYVEFQIGIDDSSTAKVVVREN